MKILANIAGVDRSWPLTGDRLTIGRGSENDVCLADPRVSKLHAHCEREGDVWRVRDAQSRNGTRVNGTDATAPVAIHEGDTIEFGAVAVQIVADDARAGVVSTSADDSRWSSSLQIRAADLLHESDIVTRDSARLVQLLADAGRLLVLPRPLTELCEDLLVFVEKAVPANRLVLLLRDSADAEPVQIAARQKGGSAREPLALSHTIMQTVLDDCAAVITADAQADERFRAHMSIISQGIVSAMAVPLFDNERVLGLLYADSTSLATVYRREDLEVFTLLANMAAVKITNARLLEAERARARLAMEVATATRIQRGLLPRSAPVLSGLDASAVLEPCYEVGGDLYDLAVRADGQLVVALGDVSGKGVGAALLMSSVLSSARVLYDACDDPAQLATRLNAVMTESTESAHFVTLFVGYIDPSTGALHYVNAGHNAPYVVTSGTVRELEATDPPVAVLDGHTFTPAQITLASGDLFAVFSDGIPEAMQGGEFFGDDRVRETIVSAAAATATAAEARDAIMRALNAFLGDAPRGDDVTLVVVRRA